MKNNNLNNPNLLQVPSYMMAIPYNLASSEILETMVKTKSFDNIVFLNLVLDEIILSIKNSKEFIFHTETYVSETIRKVNIEFRGSLYSVKLYFKDFVKDDYLQRTYLSKEEMSALENSMGVVTEIMFNENICKSYLFQLKLVNTLFGEVCALADCSSRALFSGKWLNNMAIASVPPNTSYMYNLHIVNDNMANTWIYTEGLRRCNIYDIEFLNLNLENYQICSILLPYLVSNLVEHRMPKEGMPIYLGENIYLSLHNSSDAIKKYRGIIGTNSDDRKNLHHYYLTAFAYIEHKTKELSELVPFLVEPTFTESLIEKERKNTMAREFFDLFVKIIEKQEVVSNLKKFVKNLKNPELQILEGRIKAAFPIDEDKVTIDRTNENLWFKFIKNTDKKTIKGELMSEPIYIEELNSGEVVEFSYNFINDWIIFSEIGEITPENLYLLL
ncbi:MAG: DUF4026 domain-containing protein [Lachnospirales bacterium]